MATATPPPSEPPAPSSPSAPVPREPAASPPAPHATSTSPCVRAGDPRILTTGVTGGSGIELAPLAATLGVGLASSASRVTAMSLDPTSLMVGETVHAPGTAAVRRVVPVDAAGNLTAAGETDSRVENVQARRFVRGTGGDLGVASKRLVFAPHLQDQISPLWPLEGATPDALRGVAIEAHGQRGLVTAFRSRGAIWVGTALGEPLAPQGELYKIAGLGGSIGSPTLAAGKDAVLVAWADHTSATGPWSIRLAKVRPGQAPETTAFELPPGGVGGQALSPYLTAVGGGRFLLTWTEGPAWGHDVRAQTLDEDGKPLGAPIAVSADGANAGQAQSAVLADGRGAVVYLSLKGRSSDLVATPVTCAAE